MKNQLPLFVSCLLLFSTILCLKYSESNLVDSVSYSVARTNTNEFYENHSSNFKNPQYVDKLPERKQLRGETTVIEEIKSDANYYDGTKSLRGKEQNNKEEAKGKSAAVEKLCGVWTTQPEACKKTGNCGWCASTNSCIPGNAKGPLLPCQKGAFEFVEPPKDWNFFPEGVEVNINKHKVGDTEIVTIAPK